MAKFCDEARIVRYQIEKLLNFFLKKIPTGGFFLLNKSRKKRLLTFSSPPEGQFF